MKSDIIKQAKLSLARKDLFFYCNLTEPDFYKEDRKYLKDLCYEIQEFLHSDVDILVINAPPRHGKSRTSQKAVEWVLGNDNSMKVMTGSYNETVSTQFSKGVRDKISEIKASDKIVYSEIFPSTFIKKGDGASNMWSLQGGYANYLATSPTGTATGFGADLMIIDDVIKSAYEANNANILSGHWEWFTNTMLSRLEKNGKIIVIMTRWHSKDLAGRIIEEMPKNGYSLKHIDMKALQDDGSMLCDDILDKKGFDMKFKSMGEDIAMANYQQTPIDLKGRLYSNFKIYDDMDIPFTQRRVYVDTADTGADYLCAIAYGIYQKEAYIIDVYYTKEPMEVTEVEVAKLIIRNNINIANIESNNGGRGFARAVKDKLLGMGWNRTRISWFHQSLNKIARINTNATWVMDHIYFPSNFRNRWKEFYSALYEYQREGKNLHDDASDCITGVAEVTQRKG